MKKSPFGRAPTRPIVISPTEKILGLQKIVLIARNLLMRLQEKREMGDFKNHGPRIPTHTPKDSTLAEASWIIAGSILHQPTEG